MSETLRLDAIAKANLRPPANRFETARCHAVRANPYGPFPAPANDGRLDPFVERDGMRFAGTHLIVDLWHAARLGDPGHVEEALRQAVETAGATLLTIELHRFSPSGAMERAANARE